MNIIDYSPRQTPKRRKTTLINETKSAVKLLIATLSTIIIVLGIMFLAATSENAQKGYALQQAKLRNEHLKTINTALETQITNSTSFNNIEESEKFSEMNTAEEKNYVTDEDNRVK